VTVGETARAVKVPVEVDISVVVKVSVPEVEGAVAPGPELAFEP
jgi:hypothetical protein